MVRIIFIVCGPLGVVQRSKLAVRSPVTSLLSSKKRAHNLKLQLEELKSHFDSGDTVSPTRPGFRIDPLFVRSEKLQNESSPSFSNLPPEFSSEFSPKFSRIFRVLFPRNWRPQLHQKSPPFFNAKSPGKHEQKYSQFSSGEQAKQLFNPILT